MKTALVFQLAIMLISQMSFASTKIGSNGHYLSFSGVTIVSHIQNSDLRFWGKIYDGLIQNKLIRDYYSPLPLESYHLTTMNLFTKDSDSVEAWNAFMNRNSNWFQALNQELQQNQSFRPTGTIADIYVTGTIALLIDLNPTQVEVFKKLEDKVGLRGKVPQVFHVTFGYRYREANSAIQNQIRAELQKILNEALKVHDRTLVFEVPKLSYFYDMAGFFPWDGESNPFQ